MCALTLSLKPEGRGLGGKVKVTPGRQGQIKKAMALTMAPDQDEFREWLDIFKGVVSVLRPTEAQDHILERWPRGLLLGQLIKVLQKAKFTKERNLVLVMQVTLDPWNWERVGSADVQHLDDQSGCQIIRMCQRQAELFNTLTVDVIKKEWPKNIARYVLRGE